MLVRAGEGIGTGCSSFLSHVISNKAIGTNIWIGSLDGNNIAMKSIAALLNEYGSVDIH